MVHHEFQKFKQFIKNFFNDKEIILKNQKNEDVVMGAAIQAAIMTNVKSQKLEKIIVLDVTPLSLGIEKQGGVMSVFIPRNSTLPTKKTEIFSTYIDNQSSFTISVFEGEKALTKDNHFLKKFSLNGIPPHPKGIPQIMITFDLDVNSILNVVAVVEENGISKKCCVYNEKELLSKDEIDKLVLKAEKSEDKFNKNKEEIDSKINLELYCYQVKQYIDDYNHIFSEYDKKKFYKILKWIDDNQKAKKEEYEVKYKEIKSILDSKSQLIELEKLSKLNGKIKFLEDEIKNLKSKV